MDMDSPLFPAPEGYVVDMENPQRMGVALNFWVGGVGMFLAATFLSIRIYTKTFLARNFSADDVALLCSWGFSVAIQVGILYQYARGTLGIHVWEIPAHRVNSTFNLISVASILYCPFLACAKFSLLLFYLRLSRIRWFRICVYISMFLVIGYNIALVFPLIFTCTPIMKNFDVFITGGTCLNRTPLYMATAVLNMATDVLLLVLPMPMILKLQMPKIQKAGLICIFGVGSATCVTSAVRLVLLFPMLRTIDQTWAIVTPGVWILIEANLVIITGSLPVMRLFFRHVAPRLIGESSFHSRSRSRKVGVSDQSTQHQSELKTISTQPKRNRYSRMGDDEVSIGSEERAWVNDAGSERNMVSPTPDLDRKLSTAGRIVKTETTVISSELANESDVTARRESWKVRF